MSEERGMSIEDVMGAAYTALTPVAEDVGNAYQDILLQDSGIQSPEVTAPDIGTGLPEAAPEAAPEPMTDLQLQGVIMDVQEQDFAADIAAPTAADMPTVSDMETGLDITPPTIEAPDTGPDLG
jgi:hypothetical protein